MINNQEKNKKHRFDLEDRTAVFSEKIINFLKKLPQNTITKPLISQLIRSATSVGANYCEANEANSKKDFVNKIAIAKKEIKETRYWLRLVAHTLPDTKGDISELFQESQELNFIFSAIIKNSK